MDQESSFGLPNIFGPIEGVLGSVGLTSPMRRFLFVTAMGSGVEYYFKPSYAYNADSSMKKIAFLSSEPGATYTPPGLFPALVGALSALYL